MPGLDSSSRGLIRVFLSIYSSWWFAALPFPFIRIDLFPIHFFFSFPSAGKGHLSSFWSMSKSPKESWKKEMKDVRKSWLVKAPAPFSPLTLPLTLSLTLGSEVVWTRLADGVLCQAGDEWRASQNTWPVRLD